MDREPVVAEAAPVTLIEPPSSDKIALVVATHPDVATRGNVSARDVAIHRMKYGDTITAVHDINSVPELREKHNKHHTFVYIMNGLQSGLGSRDVAVDEMPALVGLYFANASGAPLLDYKPEAAFVRIPERSQLTDEIATKLHTTFGMDDAKIKAMRKNIAELRADTKRPDAHIAINIFKAQEKAAPKVHIVKDTTSGVTIYALGMLMMPGMDASQTSTIIETVCTGLGERIRLEQPVKSKSCECVRCAWFDNSLGIVTFFATLDKPKGYNDEQDKFQLQLAKRVAQMQMGDTPPPKDLS